MARQSFSYTHGDTGSEPENPLDFQQDGRPQAQNFDWYWYTVIESINGHGEEFYRLDGNDDGVVDAADGAATWSNDGTTALTHPTDINFTGHITVVDDGDGTVSIDPSHDHDDWYVNEGGDTMSGELGLDGGANVGDSSDDSQEITFEQNGGGGFSNIKVDVRNGSLRVWRQDNGNELFAVDPDGTTYESKDRVATRTWTIANFDQYTSWTVQEGNGTESADLSSGETLEIYGGTQIYTELDSNGNLSVEHSDASTQGDVSTAGATLIDDVQLGNNGHVSNINTENRNVDDWDPASGGNVGSFVVDRNINGNNSITANGDEWLGLDGGSTTGVLLGYYNANEVRVGNGNLSDFNWNGNTVATRNWVNGNADVPNADYADNAGDADMVDGKDVTVSSSAPSSPTSGDIWLDTS